MRAKRRAVSQGTLRPTTSKVREQIMAILSAELDGARVADLFSGSGSLGLAALDEGAAEVVFVESDPRSLKVLYEEVAGRGRIFKGRLPAALSRLEGVFDVILADPPYGSADGPATLAALSSLLRPGGVAVFEHHHKEPYPDEAGDLRLARRERHGETAVSFWRRLAVPAAGNLEPVPSPGGLPVPESATRTAGFEAFAERMKEQGLHDLQLECFRRHYEKLTSGERGTLDRSRIEPVGDLERLDDLDEPADQQDLLDETVILNLNGGLGTSMGLTGPKSLLELREGLSFLDVLARQVLHWRTQIGGKLPLILMNSFNTSSATMEALQAYPELGALELLQSQVPKVLASGFAPAEWPDEPRLEWNPPGHGDVYASLYCSGMLDLLVNQGYRYLFLSNVDNLGAGLDVRIPGWMKAEGIPFVMEVADRTAADRKGGHLARLRDGRLVLRESAQCPEDEQDEFQDVERYRYFNTNNLWADLRALQSRLRECGGVIDLPLIVNAKTVDPRDPASPRVFQLETAMGAAISVFEGARALRVPRGRFAPVKTTDDLLAVRSDAYVLTRDFQIRLHPDRVAPPTISLDPAVYRLVPQLEERIPEGPPGLLHCASLKVQGDVTFGRDVRCEGEVELIGPGRVADGTVLAGRVAL